jgi:hypothetical protein
LIVWGGGKLEVCLLYGKIETNSSKNQMKIMTNTKIPKKPDETLGSFAVTSP